MQTGTKQHHKQIKQQRYTMLAIVEHNFWVFSSVSKLHCDFLQECLTMSNVSIIVPQNKGGIIPTRRTIVFVFSRSEMRLLSCSQVTVGKSLANFVLFCAKCLSSCSEEVGQRSLVSQLAGLVLWSSFLTVFDHQELVLELEKVVRKVRAWKKFVLVLLVSFASSLCMALLRSHFKRQFLISKHKLVPYID